MRCPRKDERALEGLACELRSLRGLNHPVIARGFGGVLDGERPHICVEFLEGPRLSKLIREFGPLPLEQLIPLAVQLCSALHLTAAAGAAAALRNNSVRPSTGGGRQASPLCCALGGAWDAPDLSLRVFTPASLADG